MQRLISAAGDAFHHVGRGVEVRVDLADVVALVEGLDEPHELLECLLVDLDPDVIYTPSLLEDDRAVRITVP